MTEMIDLRTPLQRERDERDEKIYEEYKKIIAVLSDDNHSKRGIWRVIGGKFGLSPETINIILQKMEKKHNQS